MKIALHGYGTMGKLVAEKLKLNDNIEFIGIVDENIKSEGKFYRNLEELLVKPDVIIDFSHFSKLEMLVDYCKKEKISLLVATTGHSESQKKYAIEKSKKFPLMMASNTSLGINILNEVIGYIIPLLEEWDIEIIEKHHNKKIDSPSGTAITLLEKIIMGQNNDNKIKYGREGISKREKNEIGIHSLRGGNIVGEHSVIFAGDDEIIEIKHEALSKSIFVSGAISAAIWLGNQNSGIYTMRDFLFSK